MPKVSIILATRNNCLYIMEAVESVLKQSYSNWELIVIDDQSTDNTSEVLQIYTESDKRIKYIKNAKRKGLVKSLNKGIKLSTGQYIGRIDGDDIWLNTDKLTKQIDFITKNPKAILVGTWGYKIDERGTKVSSLKYPTKDSDIKKYILFENCFIHSSVIFKKKIIVEMGSYDDVFTHAEDYALWLKVSKKGQIGNIPEYMVGYRINHHGVGYTNYNQQVRNTIKAVKKYHIEYPNYNLSLLLWYSRIVIPRSIREKTSKILRNIIFK